jgi:cyclase
LAGRTRRGIAALMGAAGGVAAGAGEILLTSWDRDGTRRGYDLELLAAMSDRVSVPVIASGGASSPEHLLEAIRAGASAVLAASIFHYGEYTVDGLKDFLAENGVEVRR